MLTKRLQVLLDEDRWVRLNRKAETSGQSIGALVREAIDRTYPVDDWDVMKQEILYM